MDLVAVRQHIEWEVHIEFQRNISKIPQGYITPKVYHKFRKEFISLYYEVMPYPEILRLHFVSLRMTILSKTVIPSLSRNLNNVFRLCDPSTPLRMTRGCFVGAVVSFPSASGSARRHSPTIATSPKVIYHIRQDISHRRYIINSARDLYRALRSNALPRDPSTPLRFAQDDERVFCRGGDSIPVRIRECADTLPYNYNITEGDISHPQGYITPKVYHKFRKEFISLHYEVMPLPRDPPTSLRMTILSKTVIPSLPRNLNKMFRL